MARPSASGRSRPSRMADLAARTPTGELAAIRPASSSALARSSPASTSRSSRPSSRASSAVSRRAVKIRSAARDQPSRRASSCVPPPAGMTPTLTSGRPTTAVLSATIRSQARASSSPPPSAKPCTAAMAGTGRSSTARYAARVTGRWARSSSSLSRLRSLRSAPTQKAVATALDRTTARTVGSAEICAQARLSWTASSVETALSASGRSRRISLDVGLRLLDPDPHRVRRRHRRFPTRAAHRWRP